MIRIIVAADIYQVLSDMQMLSHLILTRMLTHFHSCFSHQETETQKSFLTWRFWINCRISAEDRRQKTWTEPSELVLQKWESQRGTNVGRSFPYNRVGTPGYVVVVLKVAQLCPTLWDPMDYTVHGILQARILEWVAFLFSRGSSQLRDQTQVSCIAGIFFTSWATREAQAM